MGEVLRYIPIILLITLLVSLIEAFSFFLRTLRTAILSQVQTGAREVYRQF